ncbi:sigma-70 family RNA polymerase sigma factor [Mucilaginibacter daejeonensis]|uniref:RNA polymerase sigma factor n=1 Tax=Mucilaginibacter daejeonensis TaxID=398049 RepID=UPI001D17C4E7|nr:sigma-70 family RNA polymerase sigma factor [Mucilaginibacter daejeonensis]UEG53759.1 sigma-70 family RNA polymerase sigma factor [Mucilaginibacter daejeonensis]
MITALMPEDKNSFTLKAIKEYGKGLLSFIRRRVKSDADAEDILQDVWYQLTSVVNAAPIEQTGAWLYRVARNKITDKYRKRTETLLDDLLFDNGEEDEDSADLAEMLMSEQATPETEYLRSLVWEELFAALDELPAEQRQVFVWHELEDKSFEQMAELTGVNIQTLVSRKRYAVLHLRQRLKQLYTDIKEL